MRWVVVAALLWTASAVAFLPDARISELPAEARDTLSRIKSGGPHPYPQDGRTFYNREKRLPLRERGYYREYTVKTPAATDRGPRRIVAGRNGEYYYTEDHYRSFRRIIE